MGRSPLRKPAQVAAISWTQRAVVVRDEAEKLDSDWNQWLNRDQPPAPDYATASDDEIRRHTMEKKRHLDRQIECGVFGLIRPRILIYLPQFDDSAPSLVPNEVAVGLSDAAIRTWGIVDEWRWLAKADEGIDGKQEVPVVWRLQLLGLPAAKEMYQPLVTHFGELVDRLPKSGWRRLGFESRPAWMNGPDPVARGLLLLFRLGWRSNDPGQPGLTLWMAGASGPIPYYFGHQVSLRAVRDAVAMSRGPQLGNSTGSLFGIPKPTSDRPRIPPLTESTAWCLMSRSSSYGIPQLISKATARLLGVTEVRSTSDEPPIDLVTLDQMAGMVHRSKKTLENCKPRLPRPVAPGGGGRVALYSWRACRPGLTEIFGVPLPAVFPSHIPLTENRT